MMQRNPVSRKNAHLLEMMHLRGMNLRLDQYLSLCGVENIDEIMDGDEFVKCQVDYDHEHEFVYMRCLNDDFFNEYYESKVIRYKTKDGECHTIDIAGTMKIKGSDLDVILDQYDDSEYQKSKKRRFSFRQRHVLIAVILTDIFGILAIIAYRPHVLYLIDVLGTPQGSLLRMIIAIILLISLILFLVSVQYTAYCCFKPYKECPNCHSREDVYLMSYGLVSNETESDKKYIQYVKDEKIMNGGCCPGEKYYCKYCDIYFN